MDGKYDEVKKIDAASHIDSTRKAEAWGRFLSALEKENNPYGTADDQMAAYAKARVAHWRSAAAEESQVSVSQVAVAQSSGPREIEWGGRFVAYDDGLAKNASMLKTMAFRKIRTLAPATASPR